MPIGEIDEQSVRFLIVPGELFGVLLVAMDIESIGRDVEVSARVDNGAHIVQTFHHAVQNVQHFAVLLMAPSVLVHAIPSFVKTAPADNRRVIVVALDFREPVGNDLGKASEIVVMDIPVGVLVPDHITRFVRGIDRKRLENLFVEARAVEPEFHRQPYVLVEAADVGRGVNAVLIKALIENKSAENRTPVKVELTVAERYRAHTEIGINLVKHVFAVFQREFKVVKIALSQIPEVHFAESEVESDVTAIEVHGSLSHGFAAERSGGAKRNAARTRGIEFDRENAALDYRGKTEKVDMLRFDRFYPHRLPDARGTRVMTAARVGRGRLFARAVLGVSYVVLGEHGDIIVRTGKIIGNIETERPVTADVRADEFAVNVHGRFVIDRAEVQNLAFAVETFREVKPAAVKHRVHKALVAYARKVGFGRKRHDYLLREMLSLKRALAVRVLLAGKVDLELPLAVEVKPVFTP